MIQITPSKNLPFERRYPRETVERVKAVLREIAAEIPKVTGGPLPSYRSIAKYIEEFFPVKISPPTVKRLLTKIVGA